MLENIPIAPSAPSAAPPLQVTWKRALKVWWSIAWRGSLYCGLVGLAVGAAIGGIAGYHGVPVYKVASYIQLGGFIASVPVMIWIIRTVLRKSWSDFRIALVPRERDDA